MLYCAVIAALSLDPVAAGPAEEAKVLSREASRLEREMRSRVPDILERDPELKALTEQSKEASRKIYETLKTHPALADARTKRDTAFTQMTHTIGKGDAAAHEAAKEAYTQAEHDITAQGRTVPEIQVLMDEAANIGTRYLERRDAAYARQPETAELAKKVAELRTQAAKLRREARASEVKE